MTDQSKQRVPGHGAAGEITVLDQDLRDAIVRELDTTMLVEASAGAGKTRSMVDRMIALVREGKCRIDTLAAITFTRKAAAELRSRFQVALEQAAHEAEGATRERLTRAVDQVERAFIGTIHSFCGRLLRERPVEAAVEPSFEELEDADDARLRAAAWDQYVAERMVTDDKLLGELNELGLQIGDLQQAFLRYATYPDVDLWPTEQVKLPDLVPVRNALQAYVDHLAELLSELPEDSGNDRLMPKLRRITRVYRQLNLQRRAELMELLAEFGEPNKTKIVHKMWPGKKAQALEELDRWDEFCERYAVPLVTVWRQVRYPIVLRVLDEAVEVYNRMREEAGVLNYQDLLLLAARLLRDKPQIRQYFRRRFTHLLVDEFQDTDPVQAEVMLLLTSDDPTQTNWRGATPVPGALFVVGDPKQSIYRFRRADIVTYNTVKEIIQAHGKVFTLSSNFRSLKPIIDWVNKTFSEVFPAASNAYSPEHSPMESVHGDAHEGCPGSIEVLGIPEVHGKNDAAVAYETEAIALTIDAALAGPAGIAAANPGDFLIISARKRNLSLYAAQLAARGIPCEVTGGAVLNEIRELRQLCLCLEAVTQPDNPVALVAVLRSELFGLSDDLLYSFRRAGGRFTFRTSIPDDLSPDGIEPLQDALQRLNQYDSWLKHLPPVAAIERIAADLGLPARAAVGTGGNVRAGSIARAMELIRSAQSTLYAISEIVGYLRQLVNGEETHDGLPAATTQQSPVRIMNLHQAKGLEAPFVFLADPTGKGDHEPDLHVDRSGEQVRGFLKISVSRGQHTSEVLAVSPQWETHAAEERRFQTAEKDRLLYVAATRAGTRLVVTQREKGNRQNPWEPLHEHLANCPPMAVPEAKQQEVDPLEREIADHEPAVAAQTILERWNGVQEPSYAMAAAKAISVTPAKLTPSAGEHGTEWGSVIHVLLENATRDPQADLQCLAGAVLTEHDLNPALAEKAVETVQAVMKSELWTRAQASTLRFAEVPFQMLMPTDPAAVSSMPTVVRGVIDLVFRDQQGWVVVDYKTDARSKNELPELVEHYRGQVETYAAFWQETTGEPVAERGLYFTHTGAYVTL